MINKLSYNESYEEVKKEYKEWMRNPGEVSQIEFFKQCRWSRRKFFTEALFRREMHELIYPRNW